MFSGGIKSDQSHEMGQRTNSYLHDSAISTERVDQRCSLKKALFSERTPPVAASVSTVEYFIGTSCLKSLHFKNP